MEIRAEEHIGLVMRVAKPYALAEKATVMDSEAYANGCIGLMNAIKLFDESLGYQFSTFAFHCIHSAIRDGARKSRRISQRRYKDGSVVKMYVSSICAESSQVVDDTLARAITQENEGRLRAAVASLTGQQRSVIDLRLEGHGLKEVGEIMGFSKQRAEQVEKKAWRSIVDILSGEGNCVPADSF
jgi:RNA polymerase sigma factor (sigma-70 family)